MYKQDQLDVLASTRKTLNTILLNTPDKLKGVSMTENGVVVRLGYVSRVPTHTKYFKFRDAYSPEALAAEIINYRAVCIKDLITNPSYVKVVDDSAVVSSRNTSGINNLVLRRSTTRMDGYYSWQSCWTTKGGVRASAAFSVNKWGAAIARNMALKCKLAKKNIYRA